MQKLHFCISARQWKGSIEMRFKLRTKTSHWSFLLVQKRQHGVNFCPIVASGKCILQGGLLLLFVTIDEATKCIC